MAAIGDQALPARPGAQKKPPKTTGPRGAADSVHFRERLDGAAHFLVRRAAYDRAAPCSLAASLPPRRSGGRRDAVALKARAPDAGPAYPSRG